MVNKKNETKITQTMGKEIHVNVMRLPLLFHMAQSCMKRSGCLAWIWKNVPCLNYFFRYA